MNRELLRPPEIDLKGLVQKVHKAKGRHNTQLAMCDLYDACGLVSFRPGDEPLQPAHAEWLQESSYKAGAKAGYNLGVDENHQGLADLLSAHQYPKPAAKSVDAERLLILKAIGDAGLILIKGHTGFELIKKESVILQLFLPDSYQVV